MATSTVRETLSSRLGFLLLAAGCAIGLGNIWRFPFIVGKYGGGAFVLLYLIFLVLLGFPVMMMELAVGRASRRALPGAYEFLGAAGKPVWRKFGLFFFSGNFLLLMFYCTVAGWMPAYCLKMADGAFAGMDAGAIAGHFLAFVGSPGAMLGWMTVTTVIATLICAAGLRAGVERAVKSMMICLLGMLILLCVQSLSLPGAAAGMKFYLMPSLENMRRAGVTEVVMAAMGQAFFTLSLGVGSMEIFGSYVDRKNTIVSESIHIILLDTFVALLAGVIIFPACASFGVDAGAGPGLVFITLPNVFQQMAGGRVWGALFFFFMSLAALTTVIAVLENIVAFIMEAFHKTRRAATWIGGTVILIGSIPCALGFNCLKQFEPMGKGTSVLDLEDFLVSDNILPLGALCMVLFCTCRWGWGWKGVLGEVNTGKGLRFPEWPHRLIALGLPPVILLIIVFGYWNRFF